MDSIPLQTLSRASTISQAPTLVDAPTAPATAMVASRPTDSSVLVVPGQSATDPANNPLTPQPRTPTPAAFRPKVKGEDLYAAFVVVLFTAVIGVNVGIGVGKHTHNENQASLIGAAGGIGVGLLAVGSYAAHRYWYAPRRAARNAITTEQV